MSKERDFHKLIEQGNEEEKSRVWDKIQMLQATRSQEQEVAVPLKTKKPFNLKKWLAFGAASLIVVLVAVAVIIKLLPTPDDGFRYRTSQEYTQQSSDLTIKEQSVALGKTLLYFDWYDYTDSCQKFVYTLNETSEIICYQEIIIDFNSGYILNLYITDDKTTLDILDSYEKLEETSTVDSVSVKWKFTSEYALSFFEYQGYKYYLRIEEPLEQGLILDYVAELIP